MGYFTDEGRLVSAGEADEYFLLMEKVEGKEYFFDLERVKEKGATDLDYKRVMALSDYLAEIHSVKNDCASPLPAQDPGDVGDGECIFGILDDYPENPGFLDPESFARSRRFAWSGAGS